MFDYLCLAFRVLLISITPIIAHEKRHTLVRLSFLPPQLDQCDTENSAVQAKTPPSKGSVLAGTLLFSVMLSPCLAHSCMFTMLLNYYICFQKGF